VRATVIWFNNAKGFGFLKPEDGSADVFAHYSSIIGDGYKSLTEGQVVEFDLGNGPNGRQQANSIRVVG